MSILGRTDELARVRAAAAAGRPLLLEGDAGAGKTTLWSEALDTAAAAGRLVLAVRPAEAEAQLAFAMLGDLLATVPPAAVERVGGVRRRALEHVLATGAGGGPTDVRVLGLALLDVLAAAAEARPVTVAIDDVQWIDGDSAAALGFALRRAPDSVAVAFAARTGASAIPLPADAERVAVGGLSRGAVRELLRERFGIVLPRPLLNRLVEISGGNPFFVLELGRELAGRGDADELPLPATLQAAAAVRLGDAGEAACTGLLVAALAGAPPVDLAERAAGSEAVAAAVAAGIATIERGRLVPDHPLLAEALTRRTPPTAIRTLHRRLAELVPDPLHAARHAALGCDGPDPKIAAQLDAAADAAASRAAVRDAAELALLAYELTPADTPDDGARRRLHAAELLVRAGRHAEAESLLEAQLAAVEAGDERTEALLVLAYAHTSTADAIACAERALAEARSPRLRAVALAEIAISRVFALESGDDVRAAVAAALEEAERAEDDELVESVLAAEVVLAALRSEDAGAPGDATAGRRRLSLSLRRAHALAAVWHGELARARAELSALYADALETGQADAARIFALNLCEVEARAGEATAAAARSAELAELGARTSAAVLLRAEALALAARDPAAALAVAERALGAGDSGNSWNDADTRRLVGALALATGDPQRAADVLGELAADLAARGLRSAGVLPFAGELVEARLAVGDGGGAREAARLLAPDVAAGRPWALTTSRRCDGLLAADAGDAEAARAAFVDAAETEIPLERIRALLALGSLERRNRRWGAARAALTDARDEAARRGADWLAARADGELARVGGRRTTGSELSDSELQVAALAARGLTNQQVARELYVAVRTVESTLSRVYAKLGVRSRTELARHPLLLSSQS